MFFPARPYLIIFLFSLIAQHAIAAPKIQHWQAESGAKVYFIEVRNLPILDVQVDFPAGNLRDPADKSGLAELTATLLQAGAGELDEEQLSSRVVDLGAQLISSADEDRASLSLRTLSSPEEKRGALALMRTVLSQPTFPEDIVNREISRAIETLKDDETRPDRIADKRFAAAIYPGHPYGNYATPNSVARIQRDDLIAFHQRHYVAQQAIVSIIGDVSLAEAKNIAQGLTSTLPPGEAKAPLPPVALPQQEIIRIAHPATQAHILIGLPAIRRSADADYFALLVGNYSLGGGGFVSRLMKEVREKRGYAYSVYSYFIPRLQPGPFQIGLQTKRDQADEAIKVVDAVLKEFVSSGPSEEELSAAKKNLIDGQSLRYDSNAKLLGYLSLIGFFGLPLDYLDQFPQKIAAVSGEDVRTAFQRYVKAENLVTVIVAGDTPEKAKE